MTYQHALRYLTQAQEPSTASLLPPLSHAKMEVAPLILCLGNGLQADMDTPPYVLHGYD